MYFMFQDCKNLTQVTLGEGMTTIPWAYFKNCTVDGELIIHLARGVSKHKISKNSGIYKVKKRQDYR